METPYPEGDAEVLPLRWVALIAVYGVIPYVLSFRHLDSAGWVYVVGGLAVVAAVGTGFSLARARPPDVSLAERRLITLHSPLMAAVAVLLFFFLLGCAAVVELVVREGLDGDISWPRTVAQACFAFSIPILAWVAYFTWQPEITDRAPGVPTGYAVYDLGHTLRSFVIKSVGLFVALGLAIWLGNWIVSVAVALFVFFVSVSLEPPSAPTTDDWALEQAKTAFEGLGFTIYPTTDNSVSIAEQALINPVIQSVAFRARRGAQEFAVSVYDDEASTAIGWEEASRLTTAATSLQWSGETSGAEADVYPLLLLMGAKQAPSLREFATNEELAVVDVASGETFLPSGQQRASDDLTALGDTLRRARGARNVDG